MVSEQGPSAGYAIGIEFDVHEWDVCNLLLKN